MSTDEKENYEKKRLTASVHTTRWSIPFIRAFGGDLEPAERAGIAEREPPRDAVRVVHVATGSPPPALAGAPETLHAHRAAASAVGVNHLESHDHGMPVWRRSRAALGGVAGGVVHRRGEGLIQVEGEADGGLSIFGDGVVCHLCNSLWRG